MAKREETEQRIQEWAEMFGYSVRGPFQEWSPPSIQKAEYYIVEHYGRDVCRKGYESAQHFTLRGAWACVSAKRRKANQEHAKRKHDRERGFCYLGD